MKVLILGSNGMVGHVVYQYFVQQGHDVAAINNVEDLQNLGANISEHNYDAVINCTAIINQAAEEHKYEAVRVNALLPHFLEMVTAGTNTVVVHRSTDCIFSGGKGSYDLTDWPDATSFYARSKFLGELDNEKDITIRTSLVGPDINPNGSSLFQWFYNSQGEVRGYKNAIWTGITTIEFAREIEWLLTHKKHGLFQLVPDSAISKYDLLKLFEKYYPGNRTIVPVDNQRVDKSLVQISGGLKIPSYEEMIAEMRQWTETHKDQYSYQ